MKALKISKNKRLYLDLIFAAFFVLYPMRHIRWGLDLWDTGYNYANFTYMGMQHMDPMWLFSTYLATAIGHLLTFLPGAGSLLGMNFYTSLFAGGLAVAGYFFCTRRLGIPQWIAFAGELAALSLCWCPTAVLYNYITYVFFLGCVILLYNGLTRERMSCLFAAGVCLGCNVLVRFSNLPEAAMIVAVWAWDVIVWREERKSGGASFRKTLIKHTLWCLGGYLSALLVLFGYIQIHEGVEAYITGIKRLFAMTDSAKGYRPTSMIADIVRTYTQNLYWVLRIGVIVAAGTAGFALLGLLRSRLGGRNAQAGEKQSGGQTPERGTKAWEIFWRAAQAGWCVVAALMLVWLHLRRFCSFAFYTYGPIERPAVLFLMLTLLIAVIRIFHPRSPREEKLISGLVLLVILLTPIGSNNRLFPSMNNLFVAAPYTLYHCMRFLKYGKGRCRDLAFASKAILTAFLILFLGQSVVFGACFQFAEGTGIQNITGVIENNKTLRGIRMDPQRADWMSGISDYVNREGLEGREVILFGNLPALSYYLKMPSAFNPWSDLDSYSYEMMEGQLDWTSFLAREKGLEYPVVILDREYAEQYAWQREGGEAYLRERGVDENRIVKIGRTAEKYWLLRDFMEDMEYGLTYENEKFQVYLGAR